MSSCCSAPAKEKKWGIKDCRERECPELQRDPKWPDSAERCMVFNTMPGTLQCCIKDPKIKPEEFLRQASYALLEEWEISDPNIKTPGPKNCPAACPYKILVDGEKFVVIDGKGTKKPAKIPTCAFSGAVLGQGLGGRCMCHVLGNPEQEGQIDTLKCVIQAGFANNTCWYGKCPDGIERCKVEDAICPVNRSPRMDRGCPLWRIPAKMLPAGRAMTKEEMQEAHDRVTREAIKKESLPGGVLYKEKKKTDPKVEKKVPISALEKPKTDTKVEKSSRKTTQKEKKKMEYRQITFEQFYALHDLQTVRVTS